MRVEFIEILKLVMCSWITKLIHIYLTLVLVHIKSQDKGETLSLVLHAGWLLKLWSSRMATISRLIYGHSVLQQLKSPKALHQTTIFNQCMC